MGCEDIGSIEPSAFAESHSDRGSAHLAHWRGEGEVWNRLGLGDLPGSAQYGPQRQKGGLLWLRYSQSYGDYFCDAVGELHDQFSATGATLIGKMAVADGIECIESKAIQGDNYVGLACDEDNFYDN